MTSSYLQAFLILWSQIFSWPPLHPTTFVNRSRISGGKHLTFRKSPRGAKGFPSTVFACLLGITLKSSPISTINPYADLVWSIDPLQHLFFLEWIESESSRLTFSYYYRRDSDQTLSSIENFPVWRRPGLEWLQEGSSIRGPFYTRPAHVQSSPPRKNVLIYTSRIKSRFPRVRNKENSENPTRRHATSETKRVVILRTSWYFWETRISGARFSAVLTQCRSYSWL